MIKSDDSKILKRQRHFIAFYNYTFWAIVTLVCLIPTSTVFGQMGSSAVYSDGWADYSNPNSPQIVGCGVTQAYNNYYGHTYWVVTKVTSPGGQMATSTSYHSSSYAYVETRLP